MNWYRVSKYDPEFRDETGRYLRDEWTSVSDMGRSFDGVTLDPPTYLAIETAYVRSVREFMIDAGVTSLRVTYLEPPPDLDPLWEFGLPDGEELAPLARELREVQSLAAPSWIGYSVSNFGKCSGASWSAPVASWSTRATTTICTSAPPRRPSGRSPRPTNSGCSSTTLLTSPRKRNDGVPAVPSTLLR